MTALLKNPFAESAHAGASVLRIAHCGATRSSAKRIPAFATAALMMSVSAACSSDDAGPTVINNVPGATTTPQPTATTTDTGIQGEAGAAPVGGTGPDVGTGGMASPGGGGTMSEGGGNAGGAGGTNVAGGQGGDGEGGAAEAGAGGDAMGGSGGEAGGAGGSGGETDFVPLLNGQDLSGWIGARGDGAGQPIGEIFTAAEGNIIHVYKGAPDQSAQPNANLYTEQSFSHYIFKVEYKWLGPRYDKRKQKDRDAGILIHMASNLNKVWPPSVEMQIGDSPLSAPDNNDKWMTGDLWIIVDAINAVSLVKNNRFAEDGEMTRLGVGQPFAVNRVNAEAQKPLGEWNEIEIEVRGATESTFILNGVVVNKVFDMKSGNNALSEGRISLQAEFAELQYRNPRVKELQAQ